MTEHCPPAVRLAARAVAAGWTATTTYARGPLAVTELGPERGDGTRPRVETTVVVDSAAVRMTHADGRRADALWVRRDGATWRWSECWRGRVGVEPAPVRLGARAVAPWLESAA